MSRLIPYDVRHSLASARDEQLARVVAMVDAMPQRDAADALIAPLRPRLAQLRPCRPMTFTRLMFLPLDPIIVPGPRWRRGMVEVPRTALARLADHVQHQLGAPALARVASELTRGGDGAAARAGAVLWPASAAVIELSSAPSDWTAVTGIPLEDYGPIARTIAAVLRRAILVDAACSTLGHAAAADHALGELLAGLADTPDALAALLPILLERHAQPDQVLNAVRASGLLDTRHSAADAAARSTIEAADTALTQFEAAELPAASVQLSRIASLLAGLDQLRPTGARQGEAAQIRRRADEACRELLSRAVAQDLLEPLAGASAALTDEEMGGLEAVARDVRRLEGIGRQLGNPASYGALLHRAMAGLAGNGSAASLPPADRVRLVELLGGPDAAWAMLGP